MESSVGTWGSVLRVTRCSWLAIYLSAAGVHHDANSSSESLGGEVDAELGADNAIVSMGAGNATPDSADIGLDPADTSASTLGTVDVDDALTGLERAAVRYRKLSVNRRRRQFSENHTGTERFIPCQDSSRYPHGS